MKPINIIIFPLALGLLVSCSSDDDEPEVIVPQDATLTLSVTPGSIHTKAATYETGKVETKEGEAKINNIFAALFKEDGSLLTSSYVDCSEIPAETPDTIRISAKSHTSYTYVILVNTGNQSVTNLEQLKEATYSLEKIKVDNQPMSSRFIKIDQLKPGANYIGPEEVFQKAPADANFKSKLPVKVYRTASRIDFEKISVKWRDTDANDLLQEQARFRLKRIYVTNAKGATYLSDRDNSDNSVEWKGQNITYLHGRSEGEGYLAGLNLFAANEDKAPIIRFQSEYTPDAKWQCYVTENTEELTPTILILKGDILYKNTDTPILKDRYFFVRLQDMVDTQGNKLSGVIRNYVIRISATITGKGSDDEEYKDNASATVTVTPDEWSVEKTQIEGVN